MNNTPGLWGSGVSSKNGRHKKSPEHTPPGFFYVI